MTDKVKLHGKLDKHGLRCWIKVLEEQREALKTAGDKMAELISREIDYWIKLNAESKEYKKALSDWQKARGE